MKVSSTEPEFSVVESEKIPHMEKQLLSTSQISVVFELAARHRRLYQDCTGVIATLEKIRDSVRELEQLPLVQE